MIRVTVWNEYTELQRREDIEAVYPSGLHETIAAFLCREPDIEAQTAVITQPEQGLTQEALDGTDVLIWWGHCLHDKVSDEVAARVADAVRRGMGVIFLHSAHMSKPFRSLMGTSCTLKWREARETEYLHVTDPTHPIAAGLPERIKLDEEEMYGEFFDIPKPDSTVFIGWFAGGNVFRSGVTYTRGLGKVFYFQPGHETYQNFHNEYVQKVIVNAVRWAAPVTRAAELNCPNEKDPAEPIDKERPARSGFRITN